MRIFLATRGSQGDIYPYLAVASELTKRGHYVTLSLPKIFEKEAIAFNLNYVLQAPDQVNEMLEETAVHTENGAQSFNDVLKWIRRVIDHQFEEFVPLVKEHDIFVSANTEFASVSIAEYCRKKIIRTAFAPLIPGKKVPPAIIPLSKTNALFTPSFMWKLLNMGTNFMVQGTLNKNRERLGMSPIKNYTLHAAGNAYNYLMHSRHLGETDPDWKFKWEIGGYCFNHIFSYEKAAHKELIQFIKKDDRPAVFFTFGSCDTEKKHKFSEYLLDQCIKQGYKLIIGTGWSKAGSTLEQEDHLFLMKHFLPHHLIFPHCDAIIHHGGSGTTHTAAYAGKPQMVAPLIIDQHYWGTRIRNLKVGPGCIKVTSSKQKLGEMLFDLVSNPTYKTNAAALADKINQEDGIKNFCDYVESFA